MLRDCRRWHNPRPHRLLRSGCHRRRRPRSDVAPYRRFRGDHLRRVLGRGPSGLTNAEMPFGAHCSDGNGVVRARRSVRNRLRCRSDDRSDQPPGRRPRDRLDRAEPGADRQFGAHCGGAAELPQQGSRWRRTPTMCFGPLPVGGTERRLGAQFSTGRERYVRAPSERSGAGPSEREVADSAFKGDFDPLSWRPHSAVVVH